MERVREVRKGDYELSTMTCMYERIIMNPIVLYANYKIIIKP